MIRTIMFVSFVAALVAVPANAAPRAVRIDGRLIPALEAVESRGNPRAVGDGGRAVGILQIHPSVVADVNRRYGTAYTLAHRWSAAHSRAICRLYLTMYTPHIRRALGRNPTATDYARLWNGGPGGVRKGGTLAYAARVRNAMRRIGR